MICRRRNLTAFTIVELLVAAAITVLIVVMLGTMFGSLIGTTSRANQRIDAFRDARAALQMIQRDLTNIVRTQWQPDPFTNPPPSAPQPVTRPAAYFVLNNVWNDATNDPYTDPTNSYYNHQVYALTSTKNTGTGDVCSVGYYCRWDTTRHTYTLRRFFHDSTATRGVFTSTAGYTADSNLYTPDAPGTAANLLNDDVLASNVWDLRIIAYDKAGAVINSQTANGVTTTKPPYICDSSATTPIELPRVIEISFKAMSAEAARTLISVSNDPKDWMEPTSRNKLIVTPHAYEFRTRINF